MVNVEHKSLEVDQIYYQVLSDIKSRIPLKNIALSLYQGYGLQSNPESYQAAIRAAFNPNKPDRLSFCDVVFLTAKFGIPDLLFFLCDVCGYERPRPLSMQGAVDRLEEDISVQQTALEQNKKQLALLKSSKANSLCSLPELSGQFSVQ